MHPRIFHFALPALTGVLAATASAAVLVGNLSEPVNPPPYNVRLGPVMPDNIGIAQAFLTDSHPWNIADIQARMGGVVGTVSLTAEVHQADGAGDFLPDGSLRVATLTVPSFGVPMENATFTPTTPLSLSANTKYYFVMVSSGGSVGWDYAASMNADGIGSIPATKTYSYIDGSTSPFWVSGDGAAQVFAVNGTAVPEPAAAMAWALGLLGVAAGRAGWKRFQTR
jgi:hypothetical protein